MRGGGIETSGTEAFIFFDDESCTHAGIKGIKSVEMGDLNTVRGVQSCYNVRSISGKKIAIEVFLFRAEDQMRAWGC